MEEKNLYRPEEDIYFSEPYIDVEEWREKPLPHYYVHGGFKGTEKDGNEVRFCLYFPKRRLMKADFISISLRHRKMSMRANI